MWLSTVVHHIPDLVEAGKEMRRVLRPGGVVLIRNAFSGRTADIRWPKYFPSAHALAEQRWPMVEATVAAFAGAGFEQEGLRSVGEIAAPSLKAYCEKIRARADSSLALISDEDFEAGLRQLELDANKEDPAAPVLWKLDLLVLR